MEFRQSRLRQIHKKEEGCMKQIGIGDHVGLYEAERQTQGSHHQGVGVKKMLCKKRRDRGGSGRGESKLSEDGI